MQLVFILLTLLLLAVAVFALQNAAAVTVRFLHWEVQSSVAMITLGATCAGAVMAGLLSLGTRLRRWRRGGKAEPPSREPVLPREPRPPSGTALPPER